MAKKGIAAVNMRTVASECGIALGSLYNYFSSKSELLSATIEAVWKDIFQMGKTLEKCENIVEYLNLLFEGVENSRSRYPKFLRTIYLPCFYQYYWKNKMKKSPFWNL